MNKILKPLLIVNIFAVMIYSCNEPIQIEPTPMPTVEKIKYEKIFNNKSILSIKNFTNANFQIYKDYDVSKLPEALSATYGFWKNKTSKDNEYAIYYEIRIYESHEKATNKGKLYADDVTGAEAILKRSESLWRVGLTDRKRLGKGFGGETCSGNGCKELPKYYDYLIYNNTLILCAGFTSNESLKNCWDLVNNLEK